MYTEVPYAHDMRYNSEVQYVQGRLHVSANALSRAPVGRPYTEDSELVHEVGAFADMSRNAIPASIVKIKHITTARKEDEVCTEVRRYCHEGWPAFMQHTVLLRPDWENISHLAMIDDLLLYDERIVIPRCMRLETMKAIREGHLSRLLMGRRQRTRLPAIAITLQPGVPDQELRKAKGREDGQRESQQRHFNIRHRANELPVLQPGYDAWVRDQDHYGAIVEHAPEPRSYLVSMPKGTVRRNISALVTAENGQRDRTSPTTDVHTPGNHPVSPTQSSESTLPSTVTDSPATTRTRSGRRILPPFRLDL